ncbi:MAG: ABC transporter permease [Gemmatimonadales bacterium]|nr:ABC transporter permease [Gemmatimonadales bacterium]
MAWFHAIRERLGGMFRGGARDRALAEEIRHHLELETARQIERGHPPERARALARARFGNPEWVSEDTRDERGIPLARGIGNDLRWAIRSLRKQPGFTALALFTLALGIGVTTAAFAVLDTVLLRPLPYAESGRLVVIRERAVDRSVMFPSYPNFADWRERTRSFDGVASWQTFPRSQTVSVGTERLRVVSLGVSRRFFEVLGVRPFLGRTFTDLENALGGPPVVMVSHAFWATQMAGRTPLGSIDLGATSAEVVGVLPPGFEFLGKTELFLPHERGPGTVRNAHNYIVIARLAPNTPLQTAQTEMTVLSQSLLAVHGSATQAVDADVQPLREYLVGSYRTLLAVVFGAAALVLLIACTNLVSAQLARGLTRGRDVAIRTALGAPRFRLVRQLAVESTVLTGGGTILGIALALAVVRTVRLFGSALVPRLGELAVDFRTLAFAALVAVITMGFVGFYPALRLAGGNIIDTLRGVRGPGLVVRTVVWRMLVGFQVAIAVVLVVGSALLIRTLGNIMSADTGLNVRGVATANYIPRDLQPQEFERIRTELAAIPGVTGAALANRLPFAWSSYSAPVRRPGDPGDRDWPALAGFRVVSPEYFGVLEQPILKGRGFTPDDRAVSQPVAIITPGIAEQLWPGEDPIGKQISSNYMFDRWLTVVGVAAEASHWSMARGGQNEIFAPLAQAPQEARFQLTALLRTRGEPRALLPAVRARFRQAAPDLPVQLGILEDVIERSAADRRFAMLALTLFGSVALLLAGVGIYGVMSYTVAVRSQEIGVRMALGATPWAVQAQILRRALFMAAGGVAAGTLAGLFATRYLQSILYGVTRLDPAVFAASGGILLLTALLGAYLPARRSSRIDPLTTIRAD